MLKKSYIFVVLLALSVTGFSQIFLDLGTGVNMVGNTSYPAPYGHYFEGARHQFLIRASEFSGAPGNVMSTLGFNVGALSTSGDPILNFEIKIGHTTSSTITAFQTTGLTSVYTNASYTEKLGWNMHDFTSNFIWNGTDNVLVEVCFDNTSIGWTAHSQTFMTDVGFDASVWNADDGDPGICSNNIIDASGSNRPDMRFGFIPSGNYNILAGQVITPNNDCGLDSIMSVRIYNFGTSDTTNFDVTYIVDGGTPVTESITTNIPSNTFLDYTFTTPITYAILDTHTVEVYTTFAPDTSLEFDTIRTLIINQVELLAPMVESFDLVNDGATGDLSNGWHVETVGGSFYQWQGETGATGSFGTGPNNDNSGTGTYMYTEASSGGTGDETYLVSPCMSLDGLTSPQLSYWYHKWGANMGDLYLDVFSDGVWNLKVDSVIGESHLAATDPWRQQVVDLTSYANKYIILRFRGVRGTGLEGDMGIDDIEIYQPLPFNAGVTAILSPVTSCSLDSINPVSIELTNFGFDTITSIMVSYSLNGNTAVTETINATILPYTTISHEFADSVGLSNGLHSLKVYTTLGTDPLPNDDSLIASIERLIGVRDYPYIQDFESGSDWITLGTTGSTWALGTPNNTFISSAASGINSWVTNLTGTPIDNEVSYLESPCISFAGVGADPTIQFSHIFDKGFGEQSWLEASTDGGITWSKMGTSASGTNWYNDIFSDWWENQSGAGWRTAEHELTGLANEPNVKLRFAYTGDGFVSNEGVGVDDIMITIPYAEDLLVTGLISPISACALSATEPMEVEVFNNGYDTAYSYTVTYSVDGGTQVTDTINAAIPPGDTVTYVFADSVDLSTVATYSIDVFATIANDGYNGNDSLNNVSIGNFIQPPTPIATIPDAICPGNTVTLQETGGVGYVEWYDSPNTLQSLDTGSTYTTYPLGIPSTFYVQTSVGPQINVGAIPGAGAANGYSGSGGGLFFDVQNANGVVIQYVDINTAGVGSVSISVWNSSNVELVTKDFNITTAGANTVFINAYVPFGTDYRMLLKTESVGGVLRETTVGGFPFSYPGELSINKGTVPDNYYFFYNWTIRNPACVSPRISIPVSVGALPVNLGVDTTICNDADLTLDAGTGTNYSYLWSTGDSTQKLLISGADYLSDTVLSIGVEIADSIDNCFGDDEIRVAISSCLGINGLDLGTVSVFPNPVNNQLNVSNVGYKGSEYEYQLINMQGQILIQKNWSKLDGANFQLNVLDYPTGMYVLKIRSYIDQMEKSIPVVIQR